MLWKKKWNILWMQKWESKITIPLLAECMNIANYHSEFILAFSLTTDSWCGWKWCWWAQSCELETKIIIQNWWKWLHSFWEGCDFPEVHEGTSFTLQRVVWFIGLLLFKKKIVLIKSEAALKSHCSGCGGIQQWSCTK